MNRLTLTLKERAELHALFMNPPKQISEARYAMSRFWEIYNGFRNRLTEPSLVMPCDVELLRLVRTTLEPLVVYH
jgi:hypothetical protein